ncbi:hypothetical protein COCSUDRAFT_54210 [Coccomyxa subellipsoidea C-169]|uniref:Uncharacterized protein n=1 Tax=Coccomyxa subellipsoidea (strain C-169) TaxID=574566 RepID=I0YQR3_COCSC|nr:hypothetical protein COCSUDRAFT_54210 [Coccomyxa subellipsoidea C-169]EIE20732.1 hypothetical protein COCSUDRAFT_54210 [Coccomyxa subellipsoidea C-169]|eukprot:XP_005645276.1 hypothetical protein COCSUDRAFT_54210 [Coccomyxa subellipsoidea C-169]
MDKRAVSLKVVTSLIFVLILSVGAVQGRLLKQAASSSARQGTTTTANSAPYAQTVRPVTPSARTSSSAGTKPVGVVSIDGSTSMAGTQQTQSVRDVTPSSYAPLSQSKSSGATATTDQATVGPVRPVNSQGTAANMQSSTASGGSGQRMETMADAGSAMSMRQVP